MKYRKSQSLASHYKTLVFISVTSTVVIIYVLQLLSTPSGEWMRDSAAVLVGFADEISSAAVFNVGLMSTSRNSPVNSDLIIAPPEDSKTNKTGRYVSMCWGCLNDGRRLGNQLFNFAAMLHVAQLTGRRVAMLRHHPHGWLDRWFEVPVTHVDSIDTELCPCVQVGEKAHLAYKPQLAMLSNQTYIAGKSILLCGYFQSWKYTEGVESALRHHLRLLPNVSAAVRHYLDHIRPSAWKEQSFSRVGVHVRSGDIMRRYKWKYGYTIPQRPYFEQAMSLFVAEQQERGGRVQFIVTGDSLAWAKRTINFKSIAEQLNRTSSSSTKDDVVVDVVYSEGHDAGFDLALLSLCDGVIMSTGTYGWWGAWLANKTTVYYSNWPRAGSPLFKQFKRYDFFPPNWIPIGGPEIRIP